MLRTLGFRIWVWGRCRRIRNQENYPHNFHIVDPKPRSSYLSAGTVGKRWKALADSLGFGVHSFVCQGRLKYAEGLQSKSESWSIRIPVLQDF